MMATEQQIRELAHSIWEQEGRPHGKDVEHYFRAKKMLEDMESSRIIELAPPSPIKAIEPAPPRIEITPPPKNVELGSPIRKQRKRKKG
jgi:hypothetical protein